VEQTDADWGGQPGAVGPTHITVKRAVRTGDNIRLKGENVERGQLVLAAGTKIRPQDIGMAASLGMSDLPVRRRPHIVIISSGDELVAPGKPLPQGAIYESNGVMLAALVEQWGGTATVLPTASDTQDSIRAMFEVALALNPDILVSSAGVSVGAADYVKSVLAELGEVGFWKINIRPGKPLAYGKIRNVPFFGLPGNPVSAMVTAEIMLRPALYQMTGQVEDTQTISAVAGEDIPSDGRQSYLRVTLSHENGQIIAHLTGTQSSGALFSMVLADGLLIIPEGVTFLAKGEQAEVRLLR
jgi:molybdopterin molybdotransferase